jgi:opacity protein-like surface antigen
MKKMIAAAITAAALSMAASAAMAGTLTNVSVTLSNAAPSQPTDVDIRFTTETLVNTAPHMLYARFDGLVLAAATNQCDSNITATLNGVTMPQSDFVFCQTWNSGIQLRLRNGIVIPAGSVIHIKIDKSLVTTSSTQGVYSPTMFEINSGGAAVDMPSPMPSYTITNAPPPAPVPTLTELAMILLTAALGGFAALTVHKRRRTV